ncbi:MAG: PhzF family phenazine biosynthesis protein [Pseudomonadota bacterium]
MSQLPYVIVDVFTLTPGGGNPLAVVFDAEGEDDLTLQRIAREFNFSETTFVLPPTSAGHDYRVRIFTPTREVPFAGHPNIGTACVLAERGLVESGRLSFEELAGTVDIEVTTAPDLWAKLLAPGALTQGVPVSTSAVARALGLSDADIELSVHAPLEASVGLPFTMVQLKSQDALDRAEVNVSALKAAHADGINPDIHCYVRDGQNIEARMFAPMDGVIEDPATGSANCALVALLTALHNADDARLDWQVSQGVAMGRPSVLTLTTEKRGGEVRRVWLAGHSRIFAEGTLRTG